MKFKTSDIPAYYISLSSHAPKRKRTEGSLRSQGFRDINWVLGGRAGTKAVGCAIGHRNALEHALERNVFPFLIVEDDVVVYDFVKELEAPDDADALYVGLSTYGLRGPSGVPHYAATKVSNDVYRLWNMLAAHAIVYFNREYVEFLLRVNDIFTGMGTNQDKGRAETMKYWNVYALARPMFYQHGRYEEFTRFELPSSEMRPLSFFYTG
jgi:hypothetical protein